MKPLLGTALALLLAAAFAACGGDGEGSGESAPAPSTATTREPAEQSSDFRVPGGDNSIQNFGEEAGSEELEAASDVAVTFMTARAKGDWQAVCARLAPVTLEALEQIAKQSSRFEGKSCPQLLESLTRGAPPQTRASTIGDGIDSLRVEDERAFALYHGTDGTDYVLPLAQADGEWKVGSLAPSELPG